MINRDKYFLYCIAFWAVTCELLRSDDVNYVQVETPNANVEKSNNCNKPRKCC